jgi:hypothetical protein
MQDLMSVLPGGPVEYAGQLSHWVAADDDEYVLPPHI